MRKQSKHKKRILQAHGGIFVFLTVGHPLLYLISLAVGSVVGCVKMCIRDSSKQGRVPMALNVFCAAESGTSISETGISVSYTHLGIIRSAESSSGETIVRDYKVCEI